MTTALNHTDTERKDDTTLRSEARAWLAQRPELSLVAEILAKLRSLDLAWWSPERLRQRWGAQERMRWLRQRPDLRQDITTSLTGLAPKAARKKDPDFQAALVDSCLDDGDISVDRFEEAFDPADLACYGPAAEIWRHLCERLPWDDDSQIHQDLVAWLMRALVADKSSLDGAQRKPVLSAWDIRSSIDGAVWHGRMPLEIRVAIDDARLKHEKNRPGEVYGAKDDLAIAVPELIAANVPLKDLVGVFRCAEKALGFAVTPPPSPPRSVPPTGAGSRPGSEPVFPAQPPGLGGAPRGEATRSSTPAAESPGPSKPPPAPSGQAPSTTPQRTMTPTSVDAIPRLRADRTSAAPGPPAGAPVSPTAIPATRPSAPPVAAPARASTPPVAASAVRTATPVGTARVGAAAAAPSAPSTSPSAAAPGPKSPEPRVLASDAPTPVAGVAAVSDLVRSTTGPHADGAPISDPTTAPHEHEIDELEQTNPWAVPSLDEMWTGTNDPRGDRSAERDKPAAEPPERGDRRGDGAAKPSERGDRGEGSESTGVQPKKRRPK